MKKSRWYQIIIMILTAIVGMLLFIDIQPYYEQKQIEEKAEEISETGYLPIGSVVKAKGETVLIAGTNQQDLYDPDIHFDYAIVLYPFGMEESDVTYGIQKGDIEKVISLGNEYENDKEE